MGFPNEVSTLRLVEATDVRVEVKFVVKDYWQSVVTVTVEFATSPGYYRVTAKIDGAEELVLEDSLVKCAAMPMMGVATMALGFVCSKIELEREPESDNKN